jgi:hypothetical protein
MTDYEKIMKRDKAQAWLDARLRPLIERTARHLAEQPLEIMIVTEPEEPHETQADL